nr:sphingosine-1-phosphate phosphatase 2-like isoform X1 [Cherax quadricarinatus]XP_053630235.1 sphingosine-1-phosphate phosphatase 2-like isoform X1 [Cherax quadricarinatus]
MDVLQKLQDPQLVANFQHLFGIRRVEATRVKKYVGSNHLCASVSNSHNREIKTNIMERYLDEQSSKQGLHLRRKYKRLADTDTHKTHSRQDSAVSITSVASDSSNGSDPGWECCLGKILEEWREVWRKTALSQSQKWKRTLLKSKTGKALFWYHLFFFATGLGGELFYSVFFCFWSWNVDSAVLRRVMVIWMITMYIGQALKDILKVPRPACPPVVRLDPKWQLEYGLPSTHAMVGAAMPFSILILTLNRYQLDWGWGLAIAVTWCTCVCLSRLYLGMHTVLDVVCGLMLVTVLLVMILPWVDVLDHLALTHPASPLISFTLTVAMVVCYPATDRWTPARGDTTVIVGVGCGSLLGSWTNYQLGIIREPSLPPPYSVIWPSLNMIGLSLLRTILGLVIIMAVKAIFKSLSFATICALLQVKAEDYVNKTGGITVRHRLIVELFYKFITYIAIGFTVVYTGPMAFRLIGIERPTFYTEI